MKSSESARGSLVRVGIIALALGVFAYVLTHESAAADKSGKDLTRTERSQSSGGTSGDQAAVELQLLADVDGTVGSRDSRPSAKIRSMRGGPLAPATSRNRLSAGAATTPGDVQAFSDAGIGSLTAVAPIVACAFSTCDQQVTITGRFSQSCDDDPLDWVSLAVPIPTAGATVHSIQIRLNSVNAGKDGVGDVYLLGDKNGPDTTNILYAGCGLLDNANAGVLNNYCISDAGIATGNTTWVVMVFREGSSFAVAYDGSGQSGVFYANIEGNPLPATPAPGDWKDLANTGVDGCPCVSLDTAPCTEPSCGNGILEPPEECDGAADLKCEKAGLCRDDCTCARQGACCRTDLQNCQDKVSKALCLGPNGVGRGIPDGIDQDNDGELDELTDDIVVENQPGGIINDLEVDLVVSHTFRGDLTITVSKLDGAGNPVATATLAQNNHGNSTNIGEPMHCDPSGVPCHPFELDEDQCGAPAPAFNCLIDCQGGDGYQDIEKVFFDDQALNTWADDALGSHPAGSFKPVTPLSVFNGLDKLGTWRITLVDNDPQGDTGRLHQWSLHFRSNCQLVKVCEELTDDQCAGQVKGYFHDDDTCSNPSFQCNEFCQFDNGTLLVNGVTPLLDDSANFESQHFQDKTGLVKDARLVWAAADDFILNDQDPQNECEIQSVRFWATHFNNDDGVTKVFGSPADWLGVSIAVYLDAQEVGAGDKGPLGRPFVDGFGNLGHLGGIYAQVVSMTNVTFVAVADDCSDGNTIKEQVWQVDVFLKHPMKLKKKVKYWLEIIPIQDVVQFGQVALLASHVNYLHPGRVYRNGWQESTGNYGKCPGAPPPGTQTGLAFVLLGDKQDPFLPPFNDECADATTITDGSVHFNTTNATTDGVTHAAADCNDGNTLDVEKDIWYKYIAKCDGDLRVSTCDQADFDTTIAVYGPGAVGCPPGDADLAGCNDNGTPQVECGGITSIVDIDDVIQGDEYLIRVGGKTANDFGNGTLTVTCFPCPLTTCEVDNCTCHVRHMSSTNITRNVRCAADPGGGLPLLTTENFWASCYNNGDEGIDDTGNITIESVQWGVWHLNRRTEEYECNDGTTCDPDVEDACTGIGDGQCKLFKTNFIDLDVEVNIYLFKTGANECPGEGGGSLDFADAELVCKKIVTIGQSDVGTLITTDFSADNVVIPAGRSWIVEVGTLEDGTVPNPTTFGFSAAGNNEEDDPTATSCTTYYLRSSCGGLDAWDDVHEIGPGFEPLHMIFNIQTSCGGTEAVCNDPQGNIDGCEECEDGNTENGDGCDEFCRDENTGACCLGTLCDSTIFQNPCEDQGGTWAESETCPDFICTGACCDTDGSCELIDADTCNNSGRNFLGLGTNCDPNCCPQADVGGDECEDVTPVAAAHVITVPGAITISGNNEPPFECADTGADCNPESNLSCGFTVAKCVAFKCSLANVGCDPNLGTAACNNGANGTCDDIGGADSSADVINAADGGWWESFSIDACADIFLDLCCSNDGAPVVSPLYISLVPDCPGTTTIGTNEHTFSSGTGVDDPCADGNMAAVFRGVEAGTYYYRVFSAFIHTDNLNQGTIGPYQIHVRAEDCPAGACCEGLACTSPVFQPDCAGAFFPEESCATFSCPSGSCCRIDGSCVDSGDTSAQEKCESISGDYQGDDTTCPPAEPCTVNGCFDAIPSACGNKEAIDNSTNDVEPFPQPEIGPAGEVCWNLAAGVIGEVWHSFVATDTSVRISHCSGAIEDTVIALYEGCEDGSTQMTLLGCNEDGTRAGCGVAAEVDVEGLTIGKTYYVQSASFSEADRGAFQLTIECPIPVPACLPPAVTGDIASRYIRIEPDASITDPVAFHIECGIKDGDTVSNEGWVQLILTDYAEDPAGTVKV
ncbi:MAG: hypothetical protein V3W34_03620, partial [Phycisphaerae bacterium]